MRKIVFKKKKSDWIKQIYFQSLSYKQVHLSHKLVWLWGHYSFSWPWVQIVWWSPFFSRSSLNLEFSFSKPSCNTKVKDPSLLNYLNTAGGRIIGFLHFSVGISTMWNANSLIQILNLGSRVYFLCWQLLHHEYLHKYLHQILKFLPEYFLSIIIY